AFGATRWRSPITFRRDGDRSATAAISNRSGSRARRGRWTAWATAPRPTTPIRSGRFGEGLDGVTDGEYTRPTRGDDPRLTGPVAVGRLVRHDPRRRPRIRLCPRTRAHPAQPGDMARRAGHRTDRLARRRRLPDLPAELRRQRRRWDRRPPGDHRPSRPPRARRAPRGGDLALADLSVTGSGPRLRR